MEIYQKDNSGNPVIDEKGNKEKPYAILRPGMKVIFFDNDLEELKRQSDESVNDHQKRISYRTYTLVKFSGGQLTFLHHMEARPDNDLKKAYPKEQVYMVDEKGNEVRYGVGGTSGFTKKVSDALKYNSPNNFEPWPKLLYTKDWLNMAIEEEHFKVMPDGEIKWKP